MAATLSSSTFLLIFWSLLVFGVVFIAIRLNKIRGFNKIVQIIDFLRSFCSEKNLIALIFKKVLPENFKF